MASPESANSENDKIIAKNIAKQILEETKNIDSIKWEKLKQNSYSLAVISIVVIFASGTILFSLNLLDDKIVKMETDQKELSLKIDSFQEKIIDKLHALNVSNIELSHKIDLIPIFRGEINE